MPPPSTIRPEGEAESPTNGTLVNYVERALEDARRRLVPPSTDAYGCGVKYGTSGS
jgi:hypothetical protein